MFCLTAGAGKLRSAQRLCLGGIWGIQTPPAASGAGGGCARSGVCAEDRGTEGLVWRGSLNDLCKKLGLSSDVLRDSAMVRFGFQS